MAPRSNCLVTEWASEGEVSTGDVAPLEYRRCSTTRGDVRRVDERLTDSARKANPIKL